MIDNLPAHKAAGAREAIEARGAMLRYLPIFAGPEPDRDAFQQAQGLSAQGRRTNNSAPAPPDRQIRAYPHYPRSFQLFQACRLCVKSTNLL